MRFTFDTHNYSMARFFYSALYFLLLPLVFARFWYRAGKVPAYRKRWSERLGRPACSVDPAQPLLWIHAVSVGESMVAQSLVAVLRESLPDTQFLVTTTTPTGSELVQKWAVPVLHQYLPVDLVPMLKPLFEHYRPNALILLETEVWPNLIALAVAQGVPVALANGRMSARSARGYKRFSALTRPAFAALSMVMAQADADAARFRELGASQVEVTGSVKFDMRLDDQARAILDDLKPWVARRRVVVAGSTHDGEEALILDAYLPLRQVHPELLLILAPRHPDRFDAVRELLDKRNIGYCRRSQKQSPTRDHAVWLLDTLGELNVFYGLADVALVGGSWVPRGSHNPLEPLLYGVPVITGESIFNFQAISDTLCQAGALRRVGASALSSSLLAWLGNEPARRQAGAAGLKVLADNSGATQRQAEKIRASLGHNNR